MMSRTQILLGSQRSEFSRSWPRVPTRNTGSGAQGNTQWPGFLQYLSIEIK